MSDRSLHVLHKIRKVASYQFGRGVGEMLFPNNIDVVFSERTGKVRHIYVDGKLLATLRPTDGLFSLTIEGAKRLIAAMNPRQFWVQIQKEAVGFVGKGSDVFARHVLCVDDELRLGEEAVILDENNKVVAVGRAILSGEEMKDFKRGVAVKVRKGDIEKIKKHEGNDYKLNGRCRNCVG